VGFGVGADSGAEGADCGCGGKYPLFGDGVCEPMGIPGLRGVGGPSTTESLGELAEDVIVPIGGAGDLGGLGAGASNPILTGGGLCFSSGRGPGPEPY
jgi:hypothetical protein